MIGVQGEESKTPAAIVANVENSAAPADPAAGFADALARATRPLCDMAKGPARDGRVADVSEASGHACGLVDEVRALREANAAQAARIRRLEDTVRTDMLDLFDVAGDLPTAATGGYVCMGDLVEWRGGRYRVIGMSHKTAAAPSGKLIVRREGVDGAKGTWVRACEVGHAADGRATDRGIERRLRDAGYVRLADGAGERGEDSPEIGSAELWQHQYGSSQTEVMRLNAELSDALAERDELARSLGAAEFARDARGIAWEPLLACAESVARLLASLAMDSSQQPVAGALALLAGALDDAAGATRKAIGAPAAFGLAHKGASGQGASPARGRRPEMGRSGSNAARRVARAALLAECADMLRLRALLDARGIAWRDESEFVPYGHNDAGPHEGVCALRTTWEHDGEAVNVLWAYATSPEGGLGLSMHWPDLLECSHDSLGRGPVAMTVEEIMGACA